MRSFFLLVPAMMLTACVTPDDELPADGPSVPVVNVAGRAIGAASAERRAGGTYLRIAVQDLSPGEHGIHLHAVGRCDSPAFQSAGAHWNPAAKLHGHQNPLGPHAGDLPNIIVSANGRGTANFLVRGALGDADGTSLVIHAKPDDYRTDPSGNSGDRIGCAVLTAPR